MVGGTKTPGWSVRMTRTSIRPPRPSHEGKMSHEMGKVWGRSAAVGLSRLQPQSSKSLILVSEAGIEPAWTFWVRGILSSTDRSRQWGTIGLHVYEYRGFKRFPVSEKSR